MSTNVQTPKYTGAPVQVPQSKGTATPVAEPPPESKLPPVGSDESIVAVYTKLAFSIGGGIQGMSNNAVKQLGTALSKQNDNLRFRLDWDKRVAWVYRPIGNGFEQVGMVPFESVGGINFGTVKVPV